MATIIKIDIDRVTKQAFSMFELTRLATVPDDPCSVVDEWTCPIVDALEELYEVESKVSASISGIVERAMPRLLKDRSLGATFLRFTEPVKKSHGWSVFGGVFTPYNPAVEPLVEILRHLYGIASDVGLRIIFTAEAPEKPDETYIPLELDRASSSTNRIIYMPVHPGMNGLTDYDRMVNKDQMTDQLKSAFSDLVRNGVPFGTEFIEKSMFWPLHEKIWATALPLNSIPKELQ